MKPNKSEILAYRRQVANILKSHKTDWGLNDSFIHDIVYFPSLRTMMDYKRMYTPQELADLLVM